MDIDDDEEMDSDEYGDTIYNDDNTRDSTYLTAIHLEKTSFQNSNAICHMRLRKVTTANKLTTTISDEAFYEYADEGKTEFQFFDPEGFLIVGVSESGVLLSADKCTSKYIGFDEVNKKFCFKDNNVCYYFKTCDPNKPNYAYFNLACFGNDGALKLFVPPTTGSGCSTCSVRYIKKSKNEEKPVIRHTNEIVALYAQVPVVDHINVYELDKDKLTKKTFYRSQANVGNMSIWTKDLRKQYAAKLPKGVKQEDVLNDALNNPKNAWKTPTEYYSQINSTSGVIQGENGYVVAKATKSKKSLGKQDEKASVPKWFWVNSLRNWCTFKRSKRHTVDLMLWNGKNGWDKASEIIKSSNYRTNVLARYLYDVNRFVRGTFINSRIRYNNMEYSWQSIKCLEDTQFSNYDENTFQTVKIGKTYLNNKGTRRYPFSIGIPPVFRSSAGEIILIYRLRLPGMAKAVDVIYPEHIDFINSVCQAFFGKGDDKDIWKHWKRWTYVKDVSEEFANKVITDEDSTLIYQPEINTIHGEAESLNISFSVPRQYPETANVDYDSYVEEWSR